MTKAVVIGSGPAGLTSAIYLVRAGIDTTVISGDQPGGQLIFTTDMENFPGFPDGILGPDLMTKIREQAEKVGASFLDSTVTEVNFDKNPFEIKTLEKKITGDAVIIASGESALWLGLESEEKLTGRGVSACATCDGFFFIDKEVCLVGGGDVAIEDALFMTKIAKKVTIINRRDELRATHVLQQRAFAEPKIEFVWWSTVKEVLGEQNVIGVRIENTKDGTISEIPCSALFIAIGHKPNTEIFRGKVKILSNGFIERIDKSKTSVPGVFVAGDVFDYEYRQAITAAGSGAQAAIDAIRYLETN
ncbi:thioredoxin-disulfide reductase [Nitrosopumilus sp.]|uniref:thioredoxin-disulfide reductase n=1 Tax=Nitrosopumilus sp. TaxID=2024843 RepID=UPI00292E2EA1|nr:thioredoxin-disulfide reductase [Nitrosopumilus sp.]